MALSSAFLAELLNKLPEASRASVEAALSAPEAADAVKYADESALRRNEFSREMDRVRALTTETEALKAKVQDKWNEQNAWWEENQALVEAGRKAQTGVVPPVTPPVTPPAAVVPADVVRVADLEKLINQREAGAVAFIAATGLLRDKHLQLFGEPLDVSVIVAEAQTKKIGLQDAYNQHFQTQLAEKAQIADQARIDKIVEEKLTAERLKFRTTQPPYPVAGSLEASPLDALNAPQKPDPSQFSVEAAADEYLQLAAKRLAG